MPRIDLHAHTTCSDGSLTPTDLVRRAAAEGLAALAVTDHDTLAGLEEARATGATAGVEVIDGCEVTASLSAGVAHVLAYGFDPRDRDLAALLARVRAGRAERNRRMHERLAALAVPVDEEEVERHAIGSIVARPHFAAAMVAAGHVDTVRQAFDRYLADGAAAYVRTPAPPATEVVAGVVAAGGAPVLAHPRSLRLGTRAAYRRVLAELREAGLVGLEVDHPSQDPTQRATFGELADELDLVRTGGSDFHGASKPGIALGRGDGTIDVPYATWERLQARSGR